MGWLSWAKSVHVSLKLYLQTLPGPNPAVPDDPVLVTLSSQMAVT